MRPRCPECDCVLTREGDWDDTPTGFCSYCGWPNRYDEEEEQMSYHEMKSLAVFVAVDVTKFDQRDIKNMVVEFDWEIVHDFFESYQRTFMADVSKQLEWIEEIVEEMEV